MGRGKRGKGGERRGAAIPNFRYSREETIMDGIRGWTDRRDSTVQRRESALMQLIVLKQNTFD